METRSRRAGMAKATRSRSSKKVPNASNATPQASPARERKRPRVSSPVRAKSAEKVKPTPAALARTESSGVNSLAVKLAESLEVGSQSEGRGQKRRRKESEDDNSVVEIPRSPQKTAKPTAELENERKKLQQEWDKIKAEEKRLKAWDENLSEWEVRLVEAEGNFESGAEKTLARLEEEFACSLCFDVMAYPLMLSPSKCGHTFCAICVLKWFFSKLHRDCGKWHGKLECPICRTELPATPDANRSIKTCPFTPNRLADSVLTDLVNSLTPPPDGGSQGSISRTGGSNNSSGTDLGAWTQDGASKKDWLRRKNHGQTETSYIINNWRTLKPADFIAIHDRLLESV